MCNRRSPATLSGRTLASIPSGLFVNVFLVLLFLVTQVLYAVTPALVYRECDLTHWNGKPIHDPEAKGGVAWTPDTLLAKQDGIRLPVTGDYELSFRIKPLGPLKPKSLRCEVHSSKAILIASRDSEEIAKSPDVYQTFVVRFHATAGTVIGYELHCLLAGKFSMLLDTATICSLKSNWKDVRRIEDLHHNMGIWKADPAAARGRAWSNQNALNIGPYVSIGKPGRYRATWRIKVASKIPPDAPLLLLKVFSHNGILPGNRRGNKNYATLALSSSDFPKRDVWQTKSLDFNYDGSDKMEFIAHAKLLDTGSFAIDTITVEALGKP